MKLLDIEGIGPAFAEALEKGGVKTAEQLLEQGATPEGRHALSESAGISEKLLLEWVNHADLCRIHGIAGEYADLLEAAGVDTVVELAHRKAANLAATMATLNETKKLVRRVPTEAEVSRWIEEAKTLPRAVTY